MQTLLDIALSNALVATALAIGVAGFTYFVRRPALTHSLWLLVLLKLVTPAVVPVPLSWTANPQIASADDFIPAEPSVGEEVADASDEEIPPAMPTAEELEALLASLQMEMLSVKEPDTVPAGSSWLESLVSLWVAGSIAWLLWTTVTVIRFNRLLRHAKPAPAWLRERVVALSSQMGLRRPPAVCLIPGTLSPMIWAMSRSPRLLFPAGLCDRLDRNQLATLLVHELAHLRRRDHWLRFLELVVLGLYWWHPVVWWARRQLHEAEEQCCDAWVLWVEADASETYAQALLQTVAFLAKARSPLPVSASGIGQVPQLRRRLTMILQGRNSHCLSWAGCAIVCAFGLLLPFVPVYGQGPPPQRSSDKEAVDHEIAALKARLQMLEQQRKGEPQKAEAEERQYRLKVAQAQQQQAEAQRAQSDQIRKMEAEIGVFAKQVEAKAAELQAMQQKLAQAMADLKKMKGGTDWQSSSPDADAVKRWATQAKKSNDNERLDAVRALEAARREAESVAKAQAALARAKEAEARAQKQEAEARDKVEFTRRAKDTWTTKPGDNVDQKLERLLKEVEGLRLEIQRMKGQQNKPGDPFQKGPAKSSSATGTSSTFTNNPFSTGAQNTTSSSVTTSSPFKPSTSTSSFSGGTSNPFDPNVSTTIFSGAKEKPREIKKSPDDNEKPK